MSIEKHDTGSAAAGYEVANAVVPELVANDEPGTFEARAASFDSTAFGEKGATRFSRTAFNATVQSKPTVPLLWSHDETRPVGKVALSVDERGLIARGRLALGTKQADEARELLKLGAINGVSIGFTPVGAVGEATADGQRVRLVNQANVMEVSLVVFPADPTARVMWTHAGYFEWLADPRTQGKRMYDAIRDAQRQAAQRDTGNGAW